LGVSTRAVEETKPAATLAAGQPALRFTARTSGQKTFRFPGDYQGKLVLPGFWAAWRCPRRAESPLVERGADMRGIHQLLGRANMATT